MTKEKIVGHKTLMDGSHEPLYESEAKEIFAECKRLRLKREALMPTEKEALDVLFEAYQRLIDLGWENAIYCPKDGTIFNAIEAGSTGIHDCNYHGDWPKGSWWVFADGDMYPSRPILFKKKEQTS